MSMTLLTVSVCPSSRSKKASARSWSMLRGSPSLRRFWAMRVSRSMIDATRSAGRSEAVMVAVESTDSSATTLRSASAAWLRRRASSASVSRDSR